MQGDLIFVKPTNLIGRLISYFTKSAYCHVGILLDNGSCVAEINGGCEFAIYPNKYTKYDIYRVTDDFDANEMDNIILEMIDRGYKYDWWDIVRIMFKKPQLCSPNKMICSEVVQYVFMEMDIKLTDKCVPTPQDLIDGGKLRKIIQRG